MPAWIYKDAAQPEETIDDVKQAYALLFKAHGAVVSERDALASRVRELEAERDAAAETACGAVCKAFSLGQTYWQQADSEYSSQHRKADVTHATFKALVEETRAALTTPPSAAQPADFAGEIAYELTKRLVIDLPTARSVIEDAIRATKGEKL